MNTTEAMKQAMQALRDAGVPEDLWPTALPLALADVRAAEALGAGSATITTPPANGKPKKSTTKKAAPRPSTSAVESTVLSNLGEEKTLFAAVESETGVAAKDLGDIFHVEGGHLQIKAPGRDMGVNMKAGAQTITALLGGVVFAGTTHRKLSFKEINDVCKAKHVFDGSNSAANIKSTPGFASVGTGANQELTGKSGWQKEFAKAVDRALKKPVDPAV